MDTFLVSKYGYLPRGKGEGNGMNWENGVDLYTLSCIK